MPALTNLYDEIWVYGLEALADPLAGIDCPQAVHDKVVYTGYIRRTLPFTERPPERPFGDEPYLLTTVGGGGDGMPVVDWVLRAYEHDPGIPINMVIVLGPFMSPAKQREFRARIDRLPRVRVLTFDSNPEFLIANAAGVVSMGGYNTFCEILSFDRPAILVPRTAPRQEQLLRASRAADLGLVRMLDIERGSEAEVMAAALRALPTQRRPSASGATEMLRGLDTISRLAARHLPSRRRRPRAVAAM
jgi:predicted glycosyltransferase